MFRRCILLFAKPNLKIFISPAKYLIVNPSVISDKRISLFITLLVISSEWNSISGIETTTKYIVAIWFCVVTCTLLIPMPLAVTTPLFTVMTDVSELSHVIVSLSVFVGYIIGVRTAVGLVEERYIVVSVTMFPL